MKKTSGCVLILVMMFSQHYASAYNILGIFPHPGKSHLHSLISLMKGLAQKGHNVTVISYYPANNSIPNYSDIVVGKPHHVFSQLFDLTQRDPDNRISKYGIPFLLSRAAQTICEAGYKSNAVQEFLKENAKIDIIVTELFNTDCFLGFVNIFNCPVIGMSASTLMPWTGERLANPDHFAYIPNNVLTFSDEMTFFERLENTVITVFHKFYFKYVMVTRDKEIVQKYLGTKAGNLEELIYNNSLLLMNTHFTLNLPRPLVPNVIEVGGIHVGKSKPLPQDLEKWISESKEGVIYFSMGSMIKAHTMTKEKRDAFIKAFKRLPQRVIWKWENETMEGKSDNILIGKWMPQFDILSHPNVKAFIGHGGLLGTIEAVHCGVPMIVIPQFGDQHTNAKAIEASGGGVILHFSEVTEETVYKALKKVLYSGFQQQAKELSERFRDRPLPPLETAIYWVEYVARHKGAPHMRTAAVNMPFYQYYLIDVFAFILAIFSALIYISYFVISVIWNRLVKTKPVKVKSS